MKTNIKLLLTLLLTISLAVSCNNEELFVEPVLEEVIEDNEENEDNEDNEDVTAVDASLPCDFSLNDIQSNSTIVINCLLDLDGTTVNLPANTTILYEGGDIINGTLNFSDNSIISGELLNSTLSMGGSNPQLKDSDFNFVPSRWGIVEGKVSDAVARNNRDILKSIIAQTEKLGISSFNIDQLDAYFKVDIHEGNYTPQDDAIKLPSGFSLIMTENTHLRMQPNSFYQPTLLAVTNNSSNVLIQGGTLHGDRDEHDYSSGGTHEWGHLLRLKGCSFVTVQNVTFMDATGDGIDISGFNFANDPNYNPSHDILIKNNKLIRNRRNNMSITSAYNIIVEENEFIDAGIHTNLSTGIAPSFAIDVEADRSNGIIYEIAEDITIRNNVESGSRAGGFLIHTGDRITIEGNDMSGSISYSTSIESIIRNNKITGSGVPVSNGTAITAGREDRYERNYGNRVYGNIITGYSQGIRLSNKDIDVYDNIITGCTSGLVIDTTIDSKIYNNTIKSTINDSKGIVSGTYSFYINNVVFSNNTIEVISDPFIFVGVNNNEGEEDYRFTIENNTFNSSHTSTMNYTHGYNIINNNIPQGGIRVANSKNGVIKDNIIKSNVSHGIELTSGNSNINLSNNNIDITGNYKCISENLDDINISLSNNECI